MPLRKCAHCEAREEKESMKVFGMQAFCDDKCKRGYQSDKNSKAAEKRKEKARNSSGSKGVRKLASKKPAKKKLVPKG